MTLVSQHKILQQFDLDDYGSEEFQQLIPQIQVSVLRLEPSALFDINLSYILASFLSVLSKATLGVLCLSYGVFTLRTYVNGLTG